MIHIKYTLLSNLNTTPIHVKYTPIHVKYSLLSLCSKSTRGSSSGTTEFILVHIPFVGDCHQRYPRAPQPTVQEEEAVWRLLQEQMALKAKAQEGCSVRGALEERFSCKDGTACWRSQPEGPAGWQECQQHLALSWMVSPSLSLSLTFPLLLSNTNPNRQISKPISRQLCTIECCTSPPALSQMLEQEESGIASPLLTGDLQAPFESAFS